MCNTCGCRSKKKKKAKKKTVNKKPPKRKLRRKRNNLFPLSPQTTSDKRVLIGEPEESRINYYYIFGNCDDISMFRTEYLTNLGTVFTCQ